MPDWLPHFERAAKAGRDAGHLFAQAFVAASDNLAMLLDGLCRAPEDSAVASPAAAVVAPSPKGSDSPPRDSAIPPAPSGGTQLDDELKLLLRNTATGIGSWMDGLQCRDISYWDSVYCRLMVASGVTEQYVNDVLRRSEK